MYRIGTAYHCPNSSANSQFAVPQTDTERVRQGTKTDHVRHDLAVGPADKFHFSYLLLTPIAERRLYQQYKRKILLNLLTINPY